MRKKPARLLEEGELREYALRLLAARALTVAQLKQRLRPRAADPASVDRIVAQLKEYGALDDRRFAENFSRRGPPRDSSEKRACWPSS
jgi:SOS response regulatory protein OraA/RecX